MPQTYSTLLEPNTPKIIDRIKAINEFSEAGYEVHINFSPIIVTEGWLTEYRNLFHLVNDNVNYKDEVFAECIFLTHNEQKHLNNLEAQRPGENLLWRPELLEKKTSQFGGENLRYFHEYKRKFTENFRKVHSEVIPWNKIRYIF